MKCVSLICLLLLSAVYAAKNITLSIGVPKENPADVSYVDGKAPEDLKAGPTKNITKPKETIAQAAFIRSSNREIPKDDEIENEEFERFIQKYHSGPTIETVFVSTSPSPPAEDSEELNEENKTTEPQAEVFKHSAQLRTFERSVAHPTLTSHILAPSEHHQNYAIVNHQPHDASLHHGGAASFSGSDGYIFQPNGGAAGNEGLIIQSGGGDGAGQFVLTDAQGSGGEQQYYQFANFVPSTFNVAQNAVKTKTFEIRRPAIQKHYYDIEERVIVRPAGSIIVELDRPVAKVPTGETVIAVGGLTGSLVGNGFQQSSQGGISFANGFGVNGGGSQGGQFGVGIQQSLGDFDLSQGRFGGSGITYTSSVGAPSINGPVGGFQQSQGSLGGAQGGIGFQQTQGSIGGTQGGTGFQQSQGGVAFSTTTQSPNGSPTSTIIIGTQQQQGGIGVSQNGVSGAGFQQSQSGIVVTTTPAPSVTQTSSTTGTLFGGANGGITGVGVQQSQGTFGVPQGGISGAGFQQSQGGPTFSTSAAPGNTQTSSTTNIYVGGSSGGLPGAGLPQTQGRSSIFAGGASAGGFQQSQGGGVFSTTGAPFFPSTTPLPNGDGLTGVGFQQSQGGIGTSQGGGIAGSGFQQSQGGIYSTTPAPYLPPAVSIPNGGPNSGVGFQQSQGGIGISQGGGSFSGAGFQQSQGGVYSTTPAPFLPPAAPTTSFSISNSNGVFSQGGAVYSTTGVPFFQSTTTSPTGGGFSGVGIQQSQRGIGISQGGGFSGAGFQQSQGGVYSTTPPPNQPPAVSIPNGSNSAVGFQQSQGGIGISQGGGFSGAGFQQSQGGIYSTTPPPNQPPAVSIPNGSNSAVGFQQSQGGIGISQGGGFSGAGFQQSQGGVYSTTPPPNLPPAVSIPNGSNSAVGFQQSQGGIGISQGGGFSGAGFQQSQGGVFSTTPAPYLPPAAPTPTVLIGRSNGGFSGTGFQQSQAGIGVGGGFAGFQQSQGALGVSQGDVTRSGFQQSQGGIGLVNGGSFGGGEIIYSTTASSPSYSISGSRSIILRSQNGGGYPIVSTTTGGPIIISTLNQPGSNGNSFVVQAKSNVQSKGSVSSTTTTERSISVSGDASAFTKASSSGSIESVSKHINPYKIAVGEPNFSYPPYVEITSNGSPLGNLKQQPYTLVPRQDYPRMRYQGKLLTGEVHIDEGLGEQHESQQEGYGALSSHHQNYESPEIPPSSPQEEPSSAIVDSSNIHKYDDTNPQHTRQFVGSSKQPIQDSQTSSGAYQQPDQIYQHHFLRSNSQPIALSTHNTEQHAQQNDPRPISSHQHSAQQQVLPEHVGNQQAYPQQSAQQYVVQEPQPIQRGNYETRSRHYDHLQIMPTKPIYQQQAAQVSNQQPIHHNLVAQIRHQQLPPKQSSHVQANHYQTIHHQSTESTHSKQQQVTESLEEPLEVSDIHSSTHQQPTLFQQQVSATDHTLEPYSSGRRQYKQRGPPAKYTQDQSLNFAPSEHTVYFNNNLEHTTARSQNLEIPSEPESLIDETRGKSVESSTQPIVPTSTQRIQETTQRQTYASVLAQGKPGILYAPPKPVGSNHSPGHKQHFLRFSADGSSLFSPSGHLVHLVYSESPRGTYSHQSQAHSLPAAPIEPAKQQIPVANKGYQIQARLPTTRQSQIELSASNKPAPANEPQITRSQSHAASHQTSARYEAISSTASETATTKEHHKRGPQKYRNEQTHGAITLRSGRTYGDHRVIASTPAPSDGGAASESVQTRRIVVNHPFQTIQEVVEREPFTNIHQVTVNAPAKQVQLRDGLQEGQQKSAAYRTPTPYKVAALLNHPQATLSFHHGGRCNINDKRSERTE